MMTRALAFLAALLLSSPAFAGSATVNYSSSGSSPFRTTTDGSSNNIGEQTIWDSAAGANGLAITTNNAAKTEGVGSAGTAAGGVVTVQGVASMVPLLAAQSGTWNITNISGTISLPTGAATSALQGTNTATTAHTCSTGGFSELGCLGQIDDDVKSSIAPGTNVIGYTSNDPCAQGLKTNVAIATSAGNLQLVAGVSAKKVYICSAHIIAAGAAVINVIEGTGAACTTANEAAIWGSTTAASGESYAANGGMTYGNGAGTVGVTATAANGICLLQSGTTALAGNITYVQQ